jgi:hypothetical protein
LPNGLRMPPSLSSGRSHTIISRKPAAGSAPEPSAMLAQPVEVARREPAAAAPSEPAAPLQMPGLVQPQPNSAQPIEPQAAPQRLESTLGDQFGLSGGPALQAPQSAPIQYPTSIVQPAPLATSTAQLTLPPGVQSLPRASQPNQERPAAANAKPASGLQMPRSVGTAEPRIARATPAATQPRASSTEPVLPSPGPDLRMPNSVETVWR